MPEEIKEIKKPSVKERIVLISNEIRISKEGKNEFTRSGYFQPDDILRAINPLLKAHRLIAEFDMEFIKEIEMYRGTLTIEDFDTAASRAYKFDIPMQELKGAGRAQSAGATQTYCKRYMFMNTFNLADNKADLDNKNNRPGGKDTGSIDWEKKLKSAKNLEELKGVFASMPQKVKVELEGKKNLLKAEFEQK